MSTPNSVRSNGQLVNLKPIQPSLLWTFDNALSLLKSCGDPYILDALDEFLLLNTNVLMSPNPFENDCSDFKGSDLSLRNLLYTNISETNIKDATKLSAALNVSKKEVVRVIAQTANKNIERKVASSDSLRSKLPDDREKAYEEARFLLYTRKILQEKRSIHKIVIQLLNNKLNASKSLVIQNLGKKIYLSSSYVDGVIDSLEKSTSELISGSYKTGISDEIDRLVYTELLLYIVSLLRVLVELLYPYANLTKDAPLRWFRLMSQTSFFTSCGSSVSYTETFALMQALVTVITLLFINVEELELDENYDTKTFTEANLVLLNADSAVVQYAWAIVLLKKSILLEEKSSPSLSLEVVQNAANEIFVETSQVFNELAKLNQLLRADDIYASILASLVLTAMPLLEMTPEIALTISQIVHSAPNSMVHRFFENEATTNAIVMARAKFPVAVSPFLRLAAMNGNFALHELNNLKSYMAVFKKAEFNKLYNIDDTDTDLVHTTEPIDLYPPFEVSKKLSLLLSYNTKARMLPTGNPDEVLVTFLYNFNGWAFLGRVLQNVSRIFDLEKDKVELVVDSVVLLNRVLEDSTNDEAKLVLEAMSAYTDDSDIVEVLLRLFEQGLHARSSAVVEPLAVLLCNLMPVMSYRIWPYLSKSSLLQSNGKEGFALMVFGAVEMVTGDFSFTLAVCKLVDSLVQNCLSAKNDDYPSRSKAPILAKFVAHLVSVFESLSHCAFSDGAQKLELGVLILDVFTNILRSVYSIDLELKPANKATAVLAQASVAIVDSFLAAGSDFSRSAFPLLSMIDTLALDINEYELRDASGFWYDSWIRCGLDFSLVLITIRSSLNMKPSSFERSVFQRLPALVAAYTQHEQLRKHVLDLLTSVTTASWLEEPTPSLLSHLGRHHAQMLLKAACLDLDNAFDDYEVKIALYDFVCAVMDGSQDGLAVLFISGRDVFGEFTEPSDSTKTSSLLHTLKKNVNNMKYYPNDVSLHLVDAIALAFNSWTAREGDNDENFVSELIGRAQAPLDSPKLPTEYISLCYELKLVSKIVEILSLVLFTTKNEACKKRILQYVSSKQFVLGLSKRFDVQDYRPSLHVKAESAFHEAFPEFSLSQFASALPKRNRFGVSAVYNLALMDRLVGGSDKWPPITALLLELSINLQYVDAQISSAKAFGALGTAVCRKHPKSLTESHLTFVVELLRLDVDGVFFEVTFHERIELAFFVLYSLYNSEVKKDPKTVMQLIKVSSELLSLSNMDFLNKLTGESVFYRSLLRIIYMCLSLIKDELTLIIEHLSVFRDLFSLIVTKGTRTILIELQNEVYLARTKKKQISSQLMNRVDDLQLILSILKVFIALKTSTNFHQDMANYVLQDGTIKALLNLYSYSDMFEVNDEHLFAQLSLMFIQQLLQIEVIAQTFFSSGLLVVLVQSPVSRPIRNGGISIESAPKYHGIWTNGLLPIFVTILSKLGPSILGEFCSALHFFGKQVEFCIEGWAKDSSSIKISSAHILETSQILLLFQMMKSINVSEYVEGDKYLLPGLESEAKRDDFVDCINNLLKHPKFLSSRVVASSVDEQRVIDQGDESYGKFIKKIIDEIEELKDFRIDSE